MQDFDQDLNSVTSHANEVHVFLRMTAPCAHLGSVVGSMNALFYILVWEAY